MAKIMITATVLACLLGSSCQNRHRHDHSGELAARWHSDPASARKWLLRKTGNDKQRFMGKILESEYYNSWVVKTPGQLALAILDFPAQKQPMHMQKVFEKWVTNDADGAGSFIDSQLAAGSARDAAVTALVEGIKDESLAEAVAWARTISEQGQMYSLLESLATH